MNRALGLVFAFVLIWYIALTYGCITSHHPDEVSIKNPPSNEEVRESVKAIKCLVPTPTVKGIAIAVGCVDHSCVSWIPLVSATGQEE